ncbi:hypothetical protein [Mitsuaria sp. 7]|uniref:hypothetical protein n=1 Tax=Mitsuaria sp. 7 TaxID=1658665 RepID=UPI0007DE17E6|nr:hypothetical protein [Mitsuaria sp. 7]ANH67943.1 hypothetical protein ABE85_10805 [Mitsuaria sp. 7]
MLRGTVATSRSRGGFFKEKMMIGAIGALAPQLLGAITGGNGAGSSGGGLLSNVLGAVAGPMMGNVVNGLGVGKLF